MTSHSEGQFLLELSEEVAAVVAAVVAAMVAVVVASWLWSGQLVRPCQLVSN